MKATLDLPDDLYRRVKARSALEGRPVRSVAVELFQSWLDAPTPPKAEPSPSEITQTELDAAPWLAISRRYVTRHEPRYGCHSRGHRRWLGGGRGGKAKIF